MTTIIISKTSKLTLTIQSLAFLWKGKNCFSIKIPKQEKHIKNVLSKICVSVSCQSQTVWKHHVRPRLYENIMRLVRPSQKSIKTSILLAEFIRKACPFAKCTRSSHEFLQNIWGHNAFPKNLTENIENIFFPLNKLFSMLTSAHSPC